jgi:hypothetical protein
MAIGQTGIATTSFDAEADLPAIRILVTSHAGLVPRDVLVRAQSETARSYAALGVRLVWNDPGASLPHLAMLIVSSLTSASAKCATEALGAAPAANQGTGRLAYAFYAPIEASAQRYRIDVAKVLGIVMAHELGHLLLAREPHSSAGIMSGRWGQFEMELIAAGLLSFTKDEGDFIRSAVIEMNAHKKQRDGY